MSQPRHVDMSLAPDDVRAQLERILASQVLKGSEQLKRLLRLTVERALEGRAELLKEYNIGLEVFQRPPDYDPKVDPIVRVQARRLRAKLDEYYATEGEHDDVVIRLPKGAYVPAVEPRTSPPAPPTLEGKSNRLGLRTVTAAGMIVFAIVVVVWVATTGGAAKNDADRGVAVLPLQMFTEGGSHAHLANQITEVLTTELAKKTQIRVLSRTTATKYRETTSSLPEIARTLGVRWVVEGGVGLEGSRVYVKLRTVDARTDRKIWADAFDCDVSELVAVNSRAAQSITAAILAQHNSSQE